MPRRGESNPRKEGSVSAWQQAGTWPIRRWRNTCDRPELCALCFCIARRERTARNGERDAGWRLRAPLHYTIIHTPVVWLSPASSSDTCSGASVPHAHGGAATRGGPARTRKHSAQGGLADRSTTRVVGATCFACGWSMAGGNPASTDRVRATRHRPHRVRWLSGNCKRSGTCLRWPGGNARASGHRSSGGCPVKRPSLLENAEAGSQFGSQRCGLGRNGEQGEGPSDWVRLSTRNKPSKGHRAGGNADRARVVFGRQRHALLKPSEPQVRNRDATGPKPRRGVNRRSGEKPQGRNANPGRHARVQIRVSARREWTGRGRDGGGEMTSTGEAGELGNKPSRPVFGASKGRGATVRSNLL